MVQSFGLRSSFRRSKHPGQVKRRYAAATLDMENHTIQADDPQSLFGCV